MESIRMISDQQDILSDKPPRAEDEVEAEVESSDSERSSQEVVIFPKTPSWVQFEIKYLPKGVKNLAALVMDHYLVMIVQENSIHPNDSIGIDNYDDLNVGGPESLLAFDLLDHSVQQAKIDINLFAFKEGWSFVKVRWEKMETKDNLWESTAQIYKDNLFVYGESRDERFWGGTRELWSFDLKNHTWKECETSGERPGRSYKMESFIFQESLFLYGCTYYYEGDYRGYGQDKPRDLFALNLDSMVWTRIEQKEEYLKKEYIKTSSTLYKDHLMILKHSYSPPLFCLNLHTKDTWSTLNINDIYRWDTPSTYQNCLLVFKDMLLVCAEADNNLIVGIMDLENFNISAPKSAEEEHLNELFLSQNESDIAFKIEEKIIPSHKEILMRKSRYFEKVFNSGMAESKQDVIEIQDSNYEIFKEYLRFIYQGKIELNHEDQAIKLYTLADKYLQEDLCEKCVHFLKFHINIDNVYKILECAREKAIPQIENWCVKCFKDKTTIQNVETLIKYLEHPENLEFKENNKKIRNIALNFVLDKFEDLTRCEDANMEFIESWIFKNIEMDTIADLTFFVVDVYNASDDPNFETIEKFVIRLKTAAFKFVEENLQVLQTKRITGNFPKEFILDFNKFSNVKKNGQVQEEAKTDKEETSKERLEETDKKRMEPAQDDIEKNHELKKTKKPDQTEEDETP